MPKNRVSATTHSSARLPVRKGAPFAREPLSRAAGEKLRHCMLARGGARAPANMLRDVLGGEEPSAEAFLREVAPAPLVGAMTMDEATLARVAEALRVRLDGSPGTPE